MQSIAYRLLTPESTFPSLTSSLNGQPFVTFHTCSLPQSLNGETGNPALIVCAAVNYDLLLGM